MRLGKRITGRVQPLLVILKTVDQAKRIFTAAKSRRQSTDPLISQHVYINVNLTKADARAAYEVRCQRHQTAERRNKNQQQPVPLQCVSVSDAAASQSQQSRHNLQAAAPTTELPYEKQCYRHNWATADTTSTAASTTTSQTSQSSHRS